MFLCSQAGLPPYLALFSLRLFQVPSTWLHLAQEPQPWGFPPHQPHQIHAQRMQWCGTHVDFFSKFSRLAFRTL